jgi:DNA (cytosine-5)-methyltransferase 1
VDYHVTGSGDGARFGYRPETVSEALSAIRTLRLFIAGPPCQGHSNLNNHTRRQDPRNELYVTTVALGVALGASAFLIENVPTVQNSQSDVVATACGLLRSEGYGVSTFTLKADELGAPQRRSRFFILAVKGADLPGEFLADVASAFKAPAQPISWAINDLLDEASTSTWDSAPELTPVNQERVDYLFDNDLFDLPDAQRPDCHKNGTTYTAVYGRMHWDRPSQTITTGIGTPGQGRYIHPLRRRLITPHEAARLQGFPEWFEFSPTGLAFKRKNLAKWIGDAVHPMLGYVATMAALEAIALAASGDSRDAA